MWRVRLVRDGFFITLVLGTTLLFAGLLEDFLLPLFWATVLTIVFRPVQAWWCRLTGDRSSLSAVLTLVTVVLVVFLPLVAVGAAVTGEAVNLYDRIARGEIDLEAPLRSAEGFLPVVSDFLARFGVELERVRQWFASAGVAASRFLASQALSIGQNTLRFVLLFFLTLYVLFFFLRDGERIIEAIIRVLPLEEERERQLLDKFAEVSRATLKGTLVVGVVQGTMGGLLFWALDLPAPVFWGVIMTVLSLLPAVGSGLVWGPAAVILLATGEVVKGIVLLAGGALVIGLVDNILRPLLVGRDTKMPDFLILISTLGGLTAFGISGFVIGPIIAAFFLAVWQMFGQEYGDEAHAAALREEEARGGAAAPAGAVGPSGSAGGSSAAGDGRTASPPPSG